MGTKSATFFPFPRYVQVPGLAYDMICEQSWYVHLLLIKETDFQIAGDVMVFFVLNIVEFVGILLTLKPFLTFPKK